MVALYTNNALHAPSGRIAVSGAKNSATRLLAATLLANEPVRLQNFPTKLVDVLAKVAFLRELGADVVLDDEQSAVEVRAGELSAEGVSSYRLGIRTTYLLAGGQLRRHEVARVPYPGGCKLGNRGYDLHLLVWRALGCDVEERDEWIEIAGRLRGGCIDFPFLTVGGTENALICAAVADGESEIRNAYVTPEVRDLIALLVQMGARIEVHGNSLVRIQGAGELLRGASYAVMPDRIEALTWMVFAAITGGHVMVENVPFRDMDVPLRHLREAGVDFLRNERSVLVSPECIDPAGLQPFELACGTHPGIISDMQPFFTLLAMCARGRSRIFDYRYPERIAYAKQLARFAPSVVSSERGVIATDGPARFQGARVTSTDLRGSMALVMAALLAEGPSVVEGVEMALRGYNDLPGKLSSLGVQVEWR